MEKKSIPHIVQICSKLSIICLLHDYKSMNNIHYVYVHQAHEKKIIEPLVA